MKRTATLLAALALTTVGALPAYAAAEVEHFEFTTTVSNNWTNPCIPELVTLTTTIAAAGSYAIDDNGEAHIHFQGWLVEGQDTNGWTVTRFIQNQGHSGETGDWLEGRQGHYNIHFEVSDPDSNSDQAYTGSFTVVYTTDSTGVAAVVAVGSGGGCIRPSG